MVVTVSHFGYIKRNPISIYRAQRRGGRGKMGMTTSDDDFVADLFIASTHSYVMIFTQTGKGFWLKVHEIPQIGRTAKGKAITNLVQMASDDKIAAVLPVREFKEGDFIVMATKNGLIKKTDLMEYANPRASGIIATKIDEKDEVISVKLTSGKEDIFLTTKDGQSIRFKEDEVRATGRATYGVWGITLAKGDLVVAMEVITNENPLLTVTQNGYGKRTELAEYRQQGRGGSGIITINTSERNGPVVAAMQVASTEDIMIVTDKGKIIRTHAKDIAMIGRNTQGVRLIQLESGEKMVSVAKLAEKDEEDEPAAKE
jgi:DNA gyrase subunit A